MSNNDGIKVIVRQRPAAPKDGLMSGDTVRINTITKTISWANPAKTKRTTFRADEVFGPESTHDDLWKSTESIVEEVMKGSDGLIFAFGATGSGKTHTMEGTKECPGIIPQAVDAIFNFGESDYEIGVSMSCIEIYQNVVYDLVSNHRAPLTFERNEKRQNVVRGAISVPIHDLAHFLDVYRRKMTKRRKTARTDMNETSSRSHAVVTLDLSIRKNSTDTRRCYKSKLCLVDLAGNESLKQTGNEDQAKLESIAINKSHFQLSNLVSAINSGQKCLSPLFNASNTTRVFEEVLGGRSVGMLICCIAPGEKRVQSTKTTLEFAQKTRGVLSETRCEAWIPEPVEEAPARRPQGMSQPPKAEAVPVVPRALPRTESAFIATDSRSTSHTMPSSRPIGKPEVISFCNAIKGDPGLVKTAHEILPVDQSRRDFPITGTSNFGPSTQNRQPVLFQREDIPEAPPLDALPTIKLSKTSRHPNVSWRDTENVLAGPNRGAPLANGIKRPSTKLRPQSSHLRPLGPGCNPNIPDPSLLPVASRMKFNAIRGPAARPRILRSGITGGYQEEEPEIGKRRIRPEAGPLVPAKKAKWR